jgi:hypothetical protein
MPIFGNRLTVLAPNEGCFRQPGPVQNGRQPEWTEFALFLARSKPSWYTSETNHIKRLAFRHHIVTDIMINKSIGKP